MSETQKDTVITLDHNNTILILLQFVEVAQKAGVFLLAESDLLKRCKDYLLSGVLDAEITNTKLARQLLLQAVTKGQSRGAYTLDEAALLHKVYTFVLANLEVDLKVKSQAQAPTEAPTGAPTGTPELQSNASDAEVTKDIDLSELSAPVPLKSPRVL